MSGGSLQSPHPAQGPLLGVRILDFCSFIAGTYSATMLAEMGADVIKIEPLMGDSARHWGPFLKGESKFFQGWNRSKRGMAIDLSAAAGREIVHRLAERADVAIENFRPGVAEKLGIDYDSLKAINPRIICCSSTAFGPVGPYRLRPAYDPVLQSMAGAAAANVRFSGKVAICSVPVVDMGAAMLSVSGVLAALYHRERTGAGQRVQTSLLQGAMAVQSHGFIQALETEEAGATGIYPYTLFQTKEGLIFIAAPTQKFWLTLCETIGARDLAESPDYATNEKRTARAAELTPKIEERLAPKTAAEWERIFVEQDVPCGRVQTFAEFFEDPQVAAMNMAPVVEHPTIGKVRGSGLPVSFEGAPGAIQRPAPTLGQHTREILGELGYEDARINELARAGTIKVLGTPIS